MIRLVSLLAAIKSRAPERNPKRQEKQKSEEKAPATHPLAKNQGGAKCRFGRRMTQNKIYVRK
jgi:hypothetical protein